jgi:hypothetical protein
LQRGVADIQALMAYMGHQWCGTPEDTRGALDHTVQAMAYLLTGKNDCVKKASKVSRLSTPEPPVYHHDQRKGIQSMGREKEPGYPPTWD